MALEESKRGPKGEKGERGERGPRGDRGAAGKPAHERSKITAVKEDAANYRLVPFLADGQPAGEIDLRPMFARFLDEMDLQRAVREAVVEAMHTAKQSW